MHGCSEGRSGKSVLRISHTDLRNPFSSFLLSMIFPLLSSWDGMRCCLFASWDQWIGPSPSLCSCLFADVHSVQGLGGHLGSSPVSTLERGQECCLLLSPVSAGPGGHLGSSPLSMLVRGGPECCLCPCPISAGQGWSTGLCMTPSSHSASLAGGRVASFMVFAWCRVGIVKRVPSARAALFLVFGKRKWAFRAFCCCCCSLGFICAYKYYILLQHWVERQKGRREGRREENTYGNSLLGHSSTPEVLSQSVFFLQE